MKKLTREERQRGRWMAFYPRKACSSKKLKSHVGGERVLQRLIGKLETNFVFLNLIN